MAFPYYAYDTSQVSGAFKLLLNTTPCSQFTLATNVYTDIPKIHTPMSVSINAIATMCAVVSICTGSEPYQPSEQVGRFKS